jgi:hypothetical protein
MNALDLTREASRFASSRDFTALTVENPSGLPESACVDAALHYYYDTACFFLDTDINPYLAISPSQYADVVVTVFTVNDDQVTDRWPDDGNGSMGDNHWSLYNDNWTRDCNGSVILSEPFYTNAEIEAMFVRGTGVPMTDRGLVLVELYYCYRQVLGLPVISQIIPNPLRMHAFTLMPAAQAIPTPTPIP